MDDQTRLEDDASLVQLDRERRSKMSVRFTGGIFLVLAGYALYFARDFFMPVMLSVLLALTFAPLNRWCMRRGIPSALSASVIVFSVVLGIGGLAYGLSGPVSSLVSKAPEIARTIQFRLSNLQTPLDKIRNATKQVEEAATAPGDPAVPKVTLAQPGIMSRATGNLISLVTTIGITIVLTLFLLASGMLFYEKIIQSFQLMSDKKRALRIAHDVEREISRYLFTIFLINSVLGLCVGSILWALGFPNAMLFGVIAAVVNFLPYVGAFVGIVTVGLLSLSHYATLSMAIVPPACYFALTCLEGQFITPTIVGRRLEINSVAVFLAVAFWGWLWGVAGALIAVPMLVLVKTFCEHFEELHGLGNFLASEDAPRRNGEE